MSRPLIADPKQAGAAAKWHRQVFAMFGNQCRLCTRKAPATDAAHVVSKWQLDKHRFADPRLGRPAHRDCHIRQTRHEIDFSLDIRRDAIRVANEICKIKIKLPTRTTKISKVTVQ